MNTSDTMNSSSSTASVNNTVLPMMDSSTTSTKEEDGKNLEQTAQEEEALVEETDVMELCTALLDEDDAAAAASSSSKTITSDHHERSSTMENMQEFILDNMNADDTKKTEETSPTSTATPSPSLYQRTETIWEQQPTTAASPTSIAPTPSYSTVVTVDEQRDGKVCKGAPLIWLPPVGHQNRSATTAGVAVVQASGATSSSSRRFVPTPSIPHPGYTDRAGVSEQEVLYLAETQPLPGPKNNRIPFPYILHDMLLEVSKSADKRKIVSWQTHGRAFKVHQHKVFVSDILPEYFKQSKYTSFQRQLNLYGFRRITGQGPDHGAYYHEYFLRGKKYLCDQVVRVKLEGLLHKPSQHPDKEPKFHNYPPVLDGEDQEQDRRGGAADDCTMKTPSSDTTEVAASTQINDTLSSNAKKKRCQDQDQDQELVHTGAPSNAAAAAVAATKKMKKTSSTKTQVSNSTTAATSVAAIVSPVKGSPQNKKSQVSSSATGANEAKKKNAVSSSWIMMTNGPPSSPGLSNSHMPFSSSSLTAFKPVDSSSKTAAAFVVAPVPNPLAKQVSFLALPSLSGSINGGNDVADPPAASATCEQQQEEEANIPRCTPVTQAGEYEQQSPNDAYYYSNQEGVHHHDVTHSNSKPWLVTPVRPTPSRLVTTTTGANDSSLLIKTTTTQELMLPATEASSTDHVSYSFRSLDDSSEDNQRHHLVSPNSSPVSTEVDDDEVLMFEGKPFHYLEPFHSMESFLKYHKLNHTYLSDESSSSKESTATTKVAT